MTTDSVPFHSGELDAQQRAGHGDVAARVAAFIRDYMPDQHRAFHTSLPFLVASASDAEGRIWVSLLEGPEGFIRSPDARSLTLDTALDPDDPLTDAFQSGSDIGVLGIDFATRRRNRLNGRIRPDGARLAIDIRQTFGNCPQYIHDRAWRRVATGARPAAHRRPCLSGAQMARIRGADTLFIGTGHHAPGGGASNGYDASHRGGAPGFVQVVDERHLRIPDYAGNNFFNTIGNILETPRVGLLFVDFETGGLLQISGRASIDWTGDHAWDRNARRVIDVTIDAVIDRAEALALRWGAGSVPLRALVVTRKTPEAAGITSVYLGAADGKPLAPFQPGQHLPVVLDIPGQPGPVERSYSLSGAPGTEAYRLTIKRVPQGVASRFLHDVVAVGDTVSARDPSGVFTLPEGAAPLVLASAGVGITPVLSMLHAAAARGDRPVWFVHAARDGGHHALRCEVDQIIAAHPSLRKHILYSRPRPEDRLGRDYDAVGRMRAQTLLDLEGAEGAQYLLCGPAAFLSDIAAGLETAGVAPSRIQFETFGPTG